MGHIIAVDDAISEIFGTGMRAYPELHATFVQNPDKSDLDMPVADQLKFYCKAVHDRLRDEFLSLGTDAWFAKHHSMTEEDFIKDPLRNKLSVLLNRTSHLAYHLGQLRLLI